MTRYGTLWLVLFLAASPVFAQNPYYDHGSFPSGGSLGSSAAMRAELDLIEAGFAKLPTFSGNANKIVTVNSGATALTATDAPIPSGAAFPVSPSTNALFFITDDTTPGACDSSGGTEVTLCRWDGAAWVPVLGGSAAIVTLDSAYDGGRVINGATLAAPVEIGNGTQAVEVGGDATLGGFIRPKPLGDSVWNCWATYNCKLVDRNTNQTMLIINPLGASPRLKFVFQPGYTLLGSVPVTLYPRGAATYSEASIVSNQPRSGYIQVTDADTDAVDFRFVVTGKMAGATTATVRLYGVSDHASPSGNIVLNCAMRANRPGTDTYVAHSTTGEQAITLTPATQNRPVSAVTSAITINGTVAEFAEVEGSCEVNAGSTTSAQLTDFFLRAEALVQLSVNSWSD